MAVGSELQTGQRYRPVSRRKVLPHQPSIILACLPKAGTVYLGGSIAKTLGYCTRSIHKGSFPDNRILQHMASEFAKGGILANSHLMPSPSNVSLLREYGLNKLVLHVRDPRACVLSWTHFVRTKPGLLKRMPEGQASRHRPLNEQIAHHVETFFPKCIRWLTAWAEVIDRSDLDILVSSHDMLVSNEQALLQRIFCFYGLSPNHIILASKGMSSNYRSGDPEEWRRVIPEDQINKMTLAMPARLVSLFGWKA